MSEQTATKKEPLINLKGWTPKGEVFHQNIKEVLEKDPATRRYKIVVGDNERESFVLKDREDGKGKQKIRIVVLFHKSDEEFKTLRQEIDKAAKEAIAAIKKETGKVLTYVKPYKIHQVRNPKYPTDEAEIEAMEFLDDDDANKLPKKVASDFYELDFETAYVESLQVYKKDNTLVPFLSSEAPIFSGSYNQETNLKEGGSVVRVLYTLRESTPEQNEGKLFIKRILDGIKVIEKPSWFQDDYKRPERSKVELPDD